MSKHDHLCPRRHPMEILGEVDDCQCALIKKVRSEYKKEDRIEYGRCTICDGPVRVAIFKGTGWCSETCRKVLMRDTEVAKAPVSKKAS